MADFLFVLLRLSLFGSLLAGLLVLLRLMLKKWVGQTIFYYLWLLVLLRLCVPAGITVPLPAAEAVWIPYHFLADAPSQMDAPTQADTPIKAEVPTQAETPTQAEALSQVNAPTKAEASTQVDAPTKVDASPENPISDVSGLSGASDSSDTFGMHPREHVWENPVLWAVLWGLGVLACLWRHIWGYLRFSHTVRRSALEISADALGVSDLLEDFNLAGRVRLAECLEVSTPVQVGILRPMVVLPKGIKDERVLRDILRHELIHARRHDLLYKWFAMIVTSLHWFNPLMVLVRKEIGRTCELSCDEAVVRGMDADARRHYGETLLKLAAPYPGPGMLSAPLCEEKKKLKERLVAIVKYRKKGKAAIQISILLVAVVCGCALISAAEHGNREVSAANHGNGEVSVGDSGSGEVSDAKHGSGEADTEGNAPVNPSVTPSAGSLAPYLSVLQGSTQFLYVADGAFAEGDHESLVEKRMDIAWVPSSFGKVRDTAIVSGIFSPDRDATILKYALIDLEGDGQEEIVLQAADVAGDLGGYVILHQQGDAVYGFASHYKTFENLKIDGTYTYSDLAGTENGVCRIRNFTNMGYETERLLYEQTDHDSGAVSYLQDGKAVTEDEYRAAKDIHDKKPDAVWYDFTKIAIAKFVSADNQSDPNQYNYFFPVKVSGGWILTIELNIERLPEKYGYAEAVDKVFVYHGKTLIQTIEAASLPEDDLHHYLEGLFVDKYWEADIRDLNFDGSEDFGLEACEVGPATNAPPYAYFLWNEDKKQFDYGFTLLNYLEVDEENQRLIMYWKEGPAVADHYKAFYTYDSDGKLQKGETVPWW